LQREGSNMSNKLTDTQLVLLSAAWQRDDHCLTLPTGVQRGSARKAAAKLLVHRFQSSNHIKRRHRAYRTKYGRRGVVELVHGGHDAVLELLFGSDSDVAQDGAGELGEET